MVTISISNVKRSIKTTTYARDLTIDKFQGKLPYQVPVVR